MNGTGSTRTTQVHLRMAGPLRLDPANPHHLNWMAWIDDSVVGSIALVQEQNQVAEIRDLTISPVTSHKRCVAQQLLEHAAEYARDHGMLKVKVNHNSVCDGADRIMHRAGFKDGATRPSARSFVQFYLDLYHSKAKRTNRPEANQGGLLRLAC